MKKINIFRIAPVPDTVSPIRACAYKQRFCAVTLRTVKKYKRIRSSCSLNNSFHNEKCSTRYYIVVKHFKETVVILVNLLNRSRSTPKHREKPQAPTNRRYGDIPLGGDAIPARSEQKDVSFSPHWTHLHPSRGILLPKMAGELQNQLTELFYQSSFNLLRNRYSGSEKKKNGKEEAFEMNVH